PPVSAANRLDSRRERRRVRRRSMNTVRDVSPMTKRMTPRMIARPPRGAPLSVKLTPIASSFPRWCRSLSRHPEWNRDDLVNRDRLALVASWLELPPPHPPDAGPQGRPAAP